MPRRRRRTPLQRLGRVIGHTWWIIVGCLAAGWIIVLVAGLLSEIPLPEAAPGAQSSKVYAADDQLIGSFHGEENRTIVPLTFISRTLRDAVVATEDRGFYTHPGVSLRGIVRAAFSNLRGRSIEQGASTITQQYARTFSEVGTERTFARKLREATLAVKIERKYSKDKILEFYLNTVYFGRGAYGAEAAAQTYFKKSAADLDLAESAYLAGIIRAPQRFQLESNPQGVVSIRNEVLSDMLGAGYIDPTRMAEARSVDLGSRFKFGISAELDSPRAGYFIEYVRRILLSDEFKLTEKDLLGGGLKIYTTLDPRMQDAAEAAVSTTMDQAEDPEVALIAMDPQGRLKAMVGGRVVNDPKRARGFNFSANLPGEDGGRQAGSAFKPFALAAFVDEGKSVRSRFDAPPYLELNSTMCRNSDGTPWKVSNFEDAAFGTLDLVDATTKSVNTVYAQVMEKVVSPRKFMDVAEEAGIFIPDRDQGCALTLGTTDVTPLEMARAYATFAARGRRPDPLVVTKIVSPDGDVIAERKPRTEQTIGQNVADTVNWVLRQNIERGTGIGARLPWAAMGKTGTTQNHVDASFAGSTPELTTVVWMGYPPDPVTGKIPEMTSVHGRKITGGSFPATIWKKFMVAALQGAKHSDFPAPPTDVGEVLVPSPTPCPATPTSSPSPGASPAPATNCIPTPSPAPSPTQSPSKASSQDQEVTPTPTPSPTPGRPCLIPLLCPPEP
jgi:penicillin-binding protein 1A